MANFLGPYWIQLNYTGYAPHTMTIPIKGWNPSGTIGTVDIWSGGTENTLTMMSGFVTVLKPMFNADISFNNYLVYKQLLPADTPEPVSSQQFSGQIGTNAGGSWASAVEIIFIARTTAFGIVKLDLLDACSEDNFNPVISPATNPQLLIDYWFNDAHGFAGRDNAQPNTFLKYTVNLNQKLRKSYRLD
jgi:hypothetical protein